MERGLEVSIEERFGVDALAAVMMNFDGYGIEDYDELVAALDRFEFRSKPKRLELDMKNRDSPPDMNTRRANARRMEGDNMNKEAHQANQALINPSAMSDVEVRSAFQMLAQAMTTQAQAMTTQAQAVMAQANRDVVTREFGCFKG
uniref:Integrase core domain containing protein n=1 Tax=Solanum tuberosum TaxID=4113 RepID=M1DTQ6_SOLTU